VWASVDLREVRADGRDGLRERVRVERGRNVLELAQNLVRGQVLVLGCTPCETHTRQLLTARVMCCLSIFPSVSVYVL
jgi:hypothetical protein